MGAGCIEAILNHLCTYRLRLIQPVQDDVNVCQVHSWPDVFRSSPHGFLVFGERIFKTPEIDQEITKGVGIVLLGV